MNNSFGAAVNGGTFKSFAIGVGIGFAAGVVAGGAGDSLFGSGWSDFVKYGLSSNPMDYILFAAMAGAASGVISSAVYGGNTAKAMLEGLYGGLVGVGVGYMTEGVMEFMEPLVGTKDAHLTYKTTSEGGKTQTTHHLNINSAKEFVDLLYDIAGKCDQITFLEYVGHGSSVGGIALEFERGFWYNAE